MSLARLMFILCQSHTKLDEFRKQTQASLYLVACM